MNETTPPPLDVPAQPKTSTLAIWSLVLGILSIVLMVVCVGPVLFAIPAIICGHIAFSKIKRSGGQLSGQALAIAGFATGYASLALLLLLLPIAVPNFIKARDVSMRNACINNLRQIEGAKNEWALEKDKKEGATPTAADISPYIKGGFEAVHCPAHGTYVIGPVGTPPTCSVSGHKLSQD